MSSRRAVGEDNILAMLERDCARRTGTRASNLRLACYGAAAAFAGILIGGVAWLAYDNHKTAERLQAGHDAVVAVPPAVPAIVASADVPPQLAPPMLTAPAAAPAVAPPADASRAAVIVDEPAPPVQAADSSVPPLVMLPPQEAAPVQARPSSKPAPVPEKQAAKESEKASVKESAPAAATGPARPRTVQAATRGSGDRKADKKVEKKGEKKADKKADKAQRTAARAAKTTPQRGAGKAAADTVRPRKPVSAPPQVDSDVALISAIISQSERHRGEREAPAACTGANCPPKQTQP